jgi:TolA-binding protein
MKTIKPEHKKPFLDDFDRDAREGWRESGLSETATMRELDDAFKRVSPGSKTKNWITYLLLTVAFTGAIGTILFLNTSKMPQRFKNSMSLSIEQTDVRLPEHIDTLVELPKSEQISIRDIQSIQGKVKKQGQKETENATSFTPELITMIEDMEPLPVEIEHTAIVLKQKTGKEIYLNQLKAIDYSAYRSKPTIEIEQIILTGVPADMENEGAADEESTTKIVQIPYMDYLEKTLGYISKERWKQALGRLEEILATYPDDVNAHFYAGWCNYNLRQYDQAAANFSACLQLDFANFNEEALWYLAKSKLAAGNVADAKQLFLEIRNQKGYYSKQAEKEFKSLK